jgi:multidrug transporter EmrE-like cation transporter
MKRDPRFWLQMMFVALVTNGLGPFGLKVLNEAGLGEHQWQYLIYWYAGGLLFAAGALLRKFSGLSSREVAFGAVMGLCSLGGQSFTALSLASGLPGHIVFPITTGGSLFVVATAGIVVFRESVGIYGIAGIALGILSLVLLSIP